MIKLGKVYENMMIDLQQNNKGTYDKQINPGFFPGKTG
jgi:N-acetylmuramic acid 6-phosphate (MurNAc-6-P) etherase